MNKNNKKISGIEDLKNINSDSKLRKLMVYLFESLCMSMTFFIWYFIHGMNWFPVASQIAGPVAIASIITVLVAIKQRIFSSNFSTILAYFMILSFGVGFCAALGIERALLEKGVYVLLLEIVGVGIIFLACAILRYCASMDFVDREKVKVSLYTFSICINVFQGLISLFFPQLISLGLFLNILRMICRY